MAGMKEHRPPMKAMELVQVRLFDTQDVPTVVAIFQRETGFARPPRHAILFQSSIIPNDWSICFWSPDTGNGGAKSSSAVRCAEALRSIGLVDHAVWRQADTGNGVEDNLHNLMGRASI
jgi:hypothetical protein